MAEQATESMALNVNGTNFPIRSSDLDMTLVDFLRDSLGLTGTKIMCREGGCGACTVLVAKEDPGIQPKGWMAIHACQVLLGALPWTHIITVEGLQSPNLGLSFIQKNMINKFGMQCGFCTPGVIMSGAEAILKNPTNVEKDPCSYFDGNICRCTGYRPIMEAMQCSARECSGKDIEDLVLLRSKRGQEGKMVKLNTSPPISQWYRPSSIQELSQIVLKNLDKSRKLVAGNTGSPFCQGREHSPLAISLCSMKELKTKEVNSEGGYIVFGAAVTITEMIETLGALKTMAPIVAHLLKVGNFSLRNAATWAGNLMLLHTDNSFPSDIWILLELADGTLNIVDLSGKESTCSLMEFLDIDMTNKLIVSVNMKIFTDEEHVRTFKVMPRHQNCYAYVNASFRLQLDWSSKIVKAKPSLVFGALGRRPVHAVQTEDYLLQLVQTKDSLRNEEILIECLRLLDGEINPVENITGPNKSYRKQVAINLFYKFYLSLLGEEVSSINRSACQETTFDFFAKQTYPTWNEKFPLTKPMKRVDADLLVSGKAQYVNDIPPFRNEAYAAFVVAGKAPAKFIGVDDTLAKELPGFIGILTYKDIPGMNRACTQHSDINYERILCESEISFAGEPVAIVVADTQKHADDISKAVKVILNDIWPPVIDLEEAVEKELFFPDRITPVSVGDAQASLSKCDRVIEGLLTTKGMHHFYIEPQTSVVVPREKEVEVFTSTQFASAVQEGVAEVLGIQCNKVFVTGQRCGGAFGGKMRFSVQVAAAAAIAAKNFDRPVKMALNYQSDMKICGSRAPFLAKYKVGFTNEGILQAIQMDMFVDCGTLQTSVDGFCALLYLDNAYYCPNWAVSIRECKTNRPPGTSVRGPGSSQSKFIMESIMDEVAHSLGKNPEEIREKNFYQSGQVLLPFQKDPLPSGVLQNTWNDTMAKSDFKARKLEVEKFNEANHWKKRGIALMPLLYRNGYYNFHYTVSLDVLYGDGSVVFYHGGAEMGQGINTRMTQLVAKYLEIPVDLVSIGSTSTRTAPNSHQTGGSVTSEQVGLGALRCCEILNSRLQPIKKEHPHLSWQELIVECSKRRVELSATYMYHDAEKVEYLYTSYSAVCSEVEVDILTGEMKIVRSDILFDCGQSINPAIDLGQIEGAFVMGIGQFLQEKIIYDPTTGEEVTSGTWHYLPPMPKDIPADFRVYLAEDSKNRTNPFGSKAVGEPALCMGVSCLLAARRAVEDARERNGVKSYLRLDAPATIDALQQATLWDIKQLRI